MKAEVHIREADILHRDPDVLVRVIVLASEVRRLQRRYFKDRDRASLLESKAAETRLDVAIGALTKPRGMI